MFRCLPIATELSKFTNLQEQEVSDFSLAELIF